jgi:hypothetical protein
MKTRCILGTSRKEAEALAAKLRAQGQEPIVTARSGIWSVTWTANRVDRAMPEGVKAANFAGFLQCANN